MIHDENKENSYGKIHDQGFKQDKLHTNAQ